MTTTPPPGEPATTRDAPMRVRKLASPDVETWQQVGETEQIFVADIVDQPTDPQAKMTVGFARVAQGESLTVSFPYDEVLILTKGTFTVHTEHGEAVTARVGEVIYLPAGSLNTHQADEDAEMVYVANPPSVYAQHVADTTAAANPR
nr:hypothetical protein [Kibdelosporangium sp. MJ126-NF4]CTQ98846.1 hypothetical protein [Kibdelosporangium sp. MJ126-NF4]